MDRSTFLDRLGVRLPIVQAPIGSVTTPELAAAVSNAGGLGSLALTWRTPAEARRLIERTRALTDRPFAANFVLAFPIEERLREALRAGVHVVWTFWGEPAPYVSRIHDTEAIHFHTIGSVNEARSAIEAGVDVIVAQGVEAGGHVLPGAIPLRCLLAALTERYADTAVLAAGGIATAADIAAVLDVGASAACLGTRFICTHEADAHRVYQDAIVAAKARDTVHTKVFDKGWPDAPHRVIRNSTVRDWEQAGCPLPGLRPGEHDVVAERDGRTIERYADEVATRDAHGDLEALALYAGEGCERIDDVVGAGELVARLAAEASTRRL